MASPLDAANGAMMHLDIANDRVDLVDSDNFKSFKAVARIASRDLVKLQAALGELGRCEDENTAWISREALRRWPTRAFDQAWQASLDAMIEKARPYGWVDPASGAIKAHIEWADAAPTLEDSDTIGEAFRRAMRRLASTVTIITANEDGAPHGMIATAVTSLAMEPPSLAICVNRNASIHAPLTRTRRLCVNLLHPGHQALCADFSGKKMGKERFEAGRWALTGAAPPHLIDAQASIFCDIQGELAYGTHTIFVGRVTRTLVADCVMPLLHQNAGFGRFLPLPAA